MNLTISENAQTKLQEILAQEAQGSKTKVRVTVEIEFSPYDLAKGSIVRRR